MPKVPFYLLQSVLIMYLDKLIILSMWDYVILFFRTSGKLGALYSIKHDKEYLIQWTITANLIMAFNPSKSRLMSHNLIDGWRPFIGQPIVQVQYLDRNQIGVFHDIESSSRGVTCDII